MFFIACEKMRMMIKFLKEEEAQFSMRKSIEFAQKYWFGVVGAVVLPFASMADTACPAGMVPYQGPVVTQMENSSGECADLCDSGVRAIMMGDGSKRIDLFKVASTDKKLATKYNDQICYSDIVPGTQAGALNVDIDGNAYYVYPSKWQICPPRYTLSYDCGTYGGLTGVPPESQTIQYGAAFGVGHSGGTCYRDGYYISGWKIDGATYSHRSPIVWKWDSDMTATAVWSQRLMYYIRLCNDCEYPYVIGPMNVKNYVRYGSNFTPGAPSAGQCRRPAGAVFKGYDVYSIGNKDLETFVPAGQSLKYQWPYNLALRAVWEWEHTVENYELAFDCGLDADGNDVPGVPPATKTVEYNGLFSFDWDVGTCSYPGYYISKWQIGTTNYNRAGINTWTFTANQVATAVWTAKTYYVPYFCNNGAQTSSYLSAQYNATLTPSTTICAAPEGKVLSGYTVYDTMGNATNVFVPAGNSFTYSYLTNMSLHAVWVDE